MRIVHISDLHARADWEPDQSKLLRAFLKDVRDFHERTPVDAVVFSGDLAFSARPDQFSFAREALLDPLQDLLGLDRDRMVLAPGNHDVDISRIDQFQENGLLSGLTSRDAVNQLLDAKNLMTYLDRMAPWLEFVDDYYADTGVERLSPLVTLHRFTASGSTVAVACLTSAWRATGEGDDADRAHLIVGDRQMTRAADELGDADVKIAVMHHPLDWLAEFDRGDVRRELGRFDVLCTGHVHVVDPVGLASKTGPLMHSMAGSLYQSRDYLNAYSVVDVDRTHAPHAFTVHVRSYFDSRDAFDEGLNVVPGGRQVIDFAEPGRPVPAPPPEEEVVTRTAADLATERLLDAVRERSLNLAPDRWQMDMDRLLVPPVLLHLPVEQYLALTDLEEGRITPDDLAASLSEHRHFVVVGDEYCGLTSTLQWLAYTAYRLDTQYAPVVIDFTAVESGANGVDREVRKQLALAGIPTGKRDALPRLALAVDNVAPRSEKRLRNLLRFMAQHPQNMYILGSRTTVGQRLGDELIREGWTCRVRYIGPFGRRELRALVRLLRPEESDSDVTAILDLLSRGRLPRTPAMLAALVATAGQGDWTAGVNNTAILESYLGLLLGRDDPSVDRRFELDFRDLQDILSCLNEHLTLEGKDALPRMEAEQFLLDYFKGLGWSEPPGAVLDALIAKRIIGQRDGLIYFCQPMVRPLLAAYRMEASEELQLLVRDNPLDYAQVIRHTAALRRNDATLLRRVMDGFRDLRERLGDGASDPFSVLAAPEGWRALDDTESLLDELWPPDLAYTPPGPPAEVQGEFNVMLDELHDQADAMRTMVQDNREGGGFTRSDFEVFVEWLDLLADVLRSSELVRDLDLKRQALWLTLNGYGVRAALMADEWNRQGSRQGIRQALSEVLEQQELREVLADDSEVSEDEFEKLMGRIELFSPVLASYAALSQVLASGKLSRLTEEALCQEAFMEQPGQALMAVLLMRRMGGREWVRHASAVVKLHGEREVIGEIMRLFALTSYVRTDLGREELASYESLLVDIAAQRKELPTEGPAPARDYPRNQMLKALRNRRLQFLQRGGDGDAKWIEAH
ncbi:metallophosphoesterase [Streptomyces sp. cf386]|uniref:metallophosphoesterase n=1 Tax=Streptomyces sp. cf386 TaxID=1761904 RepID=UPI0015A1573D|nr:metallophosphoesterase [Streptomyces sp. cf386]